jgi:hypothetical protein
LQRSCPCACRHTSSGTEISRSAHFSPFATRNSLCIAAASADVFAADAVMAKAMGFEPLAPGLLHYGNQLGLGIADLHHIDGLETPITYVQRAFKPHEKIHVQLQWQVPQAVQMLNGSCSMLNG